LRESPGKPAPETAAPVRRIQGMATFIPELASVDCRVAVLALAAGQVSLGRHLLSRAALLLRIRAVEPTLPRAQESAFDC
jgi:hypothetical protein